MLIHSHRHKPDDIELWEELHAADVAYGRQFLQQEKVNKSIKAIEDFAAGGGCYVACSWGKDSVVAIHLCRQANPDIPIVNLRCNNRNPDCDAVRDAYLQLLPSVYTEIFIDYGTLHTQNLPLEILDRATDKLWHGAIAKAKLQFGERYITGIRADESTGRKIRCCRWGTTSKTACAPLAWWTTADVFGYLAINDLPTHPAYAMLGNGCWPHDRIRVAEIGDTHGTGGGRTEWEREYYGDVLNRLAAQRAHSSGSSASSGNVTV